jgi:hypothetical protein
MNSEMDMSNSNLEMEKDNFKYILGNIFFTSVLTLLSFFQVYVYYQHSDNRAKYICIGSFLLTFISLFLISKNLPLSLLTSMIAANLLFNCGSVNVLNNNDDEEKEKLEKLEEEVTEIKSEQYNRKKNVEVSNVHDDMEKKAKYDEVGKPVPDLEQKKTKDKFMTASKFKPYLTGDNNNKAYPSAPSILQFQK